MLLNVNQTDEWLEKYWSNRNQLNFYENLRTEKSNFKHVENSLETLNPGRRTTTQWLVSYRVKIVIFSGLSIVR